MKMSELIDKIRTWWNNWRNPPEEEVALQAKVSKVPSVGDTPLTNIKGVGPSTAIKFSIHGYKTVEQIIVMDPDTLAAITGISVATCTRLIREGRLLLT